MQKMDKADFDINSILTDDDCRPLLCKVSAVANSRTLVLAKTDLQIVSDVCQSLANNMCLTPDDRAFFKRAHIPAVLVKVSFLDGCLVPKKTFIRAAREKAWTKYHKAYLENMNSVMEVTQSASAAAWLCLKTFEKLIFLNYSAASHSQIMSRTTDVGEEMKDIIAHIGGSIISKIQRVCGKDDSECLKALCTKEGTSALTTALNRGGLTFLTVEGKEFFFLLEIKFRETCDSGLATCKDTDFELACSTDDEIVELFYKMMYKNDDFTQHHLFSQVTRIYFRIRVHHECHKYLEHHRQMHGSKSKKSLRKSLKEGGDAK